MKEKIENIFSKYKSDEIIIYAHADHDGICAAAGLNYLFGDIETFFSQPFRPRELPISENKKLFIICDLLLSAQQIFYCLNKGLEVINLDHHDIRDIRHNKYMCLNPKKIYDKEFISSSGLVWKLFRPEEIAWILGAGSLGDLAVEDVPDLFEYLNKKHPELVPATDIKSLYYSKNFELAQILLMSFNEPELGFNLIKKSIKEGYNVIYQSNLYKDYINKQTYIENFLKKCADKFIQNKLYVLMDSSGEKYASSYSVKLNLLNKDNRIYIEYDNGRLFFRNYFGDADIRNLARLFGGDGPHRRSGGAYTRKSFENVKELINNHFNRQVQQKLFDTECE